jgi:glycosyltransferase involved in cell wall biosynthesis
MPRLLLIAERFPPDIGGLASSAERITTSLTQLGRTVDILVWSRYLQPGEVTVTEQEERTIYRVGLYRHWDMSMMRTLTVLEWLTTQHLYDVIWGHYLFPAGFVAVWFARSQGLKSIVSARGNDVDRATFPPGDFARLLWTLNHADVITAVSQDIAKKINIVCQRDNIFITRNAVDTDIFTPQLDPVQKAELKTSLAIAENEIVLGFSGELREKKGQAFLLAAFSKVRQVYPACLLIIGEVRNTPEATFPIYAQNYPEDYQRAIVTHHIDNSQTVAQYLQLCDLFVLPSLWEGLPNSLLEAMACGCLCLGSDAGGIPEAIAHQQDGLLLSRFHLQHLGEAILEALAMDEETKQKIKTAAREKILADYSIDAELTRLQEVFDYLQPKSS